MKWQKLSSIWRVFLITSNLSPPSECPCFWNVTSFHNPEWHTHRLSHFWRGAAWIGQGQLLRLCVCVCVWKAVWPYSNPCMRVHMHVCVCTSVCVCVLPRMYSKCVSVHVFLCVFVCVCGCLWLFINPKNLRRTFLPSVLRERSCKTTRKENQGWVHPQYSNLVTMSPPQYIDIKIFVNI